MSKYRDLARQVTRQKRSESDERPSEAEEKARLRASQLRFNEVAKDYAETQFKDIAEDISSQGVAVKSGFHDNRPTGAQNDETHPEPEIPKLHFYAEILGHKLSVYWSDYNKSVIFSSFLFPIRDKRAKHNTRDLMVSIDDLDKAAFDDLVGRFLDLVFEKEINS